MKHIKIALSLFVCLLFITACPSDSNDSSSLDGQWTISIDDSIEALTKGKSMNTQELEMTKNMLAKSMSTFTLDFNMKEMKIVVNLGGFKDENAFTVVKSENNTHTLDFNGKNIIVELKDDKLFFNDGSTIGSLVFKRK